MQAVAAVMGRKKTQKHHRQQWRFWRNASPVVKSTRRSSRKSVRSCRKPPNLPPAAERAAADLTPLATAAAARGMAHMRGAAHLAAVIASFQKQKARL